MQHYPRLKNLIHLFRTFAYSLNSYKIRCFNISAKRQGGEVSKMTKPKRNTSPRRKYTESIRHKRARRCCRTERKRISANCWCSTCWRLLFVNEGCCHAEDSEITAGPKWFRKISLFLPLFITAIKRTVWHKAIKRTGSRSCRHYADFRDHLISLFHFFMLSAFA